MSDKGTMLRKKAPALVTRRNFLVRAVKGTGGIMCFGLAGCSGDVFSPFLESQNPVEYSESEISDNWSVASVSDGFIYDPAEGLPEEQLFTVEGDGGHNVVNRPSGLSLEVDGSGRPRWFVKTSPLAASGEIHLESSISALWANASNTDNGVGFAIDEGQGQQRIWVSCTMVSGSPRIHLAGSGQTIAADWTGAPVEIKFGRTADGDAYLDVPGIGAATARRRNLQSSIGGEPHFAFGCFFEGQSVRGWFGRIGPPDVALTSDLEITNIELQPNGAERVHVEGVLSTGLDSATVDIEKVGLRCEIDGLRFYPTTDEDFMPVDMRRDGTKWVLTQDARRETGIQSLEVFDKGDGVFRFHFNDARTRLMDQEFAEVTVVVTLHLNDGGVIEGKKAVSLARSGHTLRGPA